MLRKTSIVPLAQLWNHRLVSADVVYVAFFTDTAGIKAVLPPIENESINTRRMEMRCCQCAREVSFTQIECSMIKYS